MYTKWTFSVHRFLAWCTLISRAERAEWEGAPAFSAGAAHSPCWPRHVFLSGAYRLKRFHALGRRSRPQRAAASVRELK